MKRKMFFLALLCMMILVMAACGKTSSESEVVEKSEEMREQNNVVQQTETVSDVEGEEKANDTNIVEETEEALAEQTEELAEQDINMQEETSVDSMQEKTELQGKYFKVDESAYEYLLSNEEMGSKQRTVLGFNMPEGYKMSMGRGFDNYYTYVVGWSYNENTNKLLEVCSEEVFFQCYYEEKADMPSDAVWSILEKREEEVISTPFGDAIIYYAKLQRNYMEENLVCDGEIAILRNQDTNIIIIYGDTYVPYDGIYDANLKTLLGEMLE